MLFIIHSNTKFYINTMRFMFRYIAMFLLFFSSAFYVALTAKLLARMLRLDRLYFVVYTIEPL